MLIRSVLLPDGFNKMKYPEQVDVNGGAKVMDGCKTV